MCETRNRKLTVFILSLLALILVSGVCMAIDRSLDSSQHVELVSKKPLLTAYRYEDYSDDLLFMGQPAAVDTETSTIYIPRDLKVSENALDLLHQIRLKAPGSRLYFLQDPYLEDLSLAVKENHAFTLLITDRLSRYMEYKVIFTGLPVITLNGLHSDTDEAKGREIYTGEIVLWDPQSSENGLSTMQLSKLQWHTRGKTAAVLEKKPLKLDLLKSNGKKRHMDLLGLGEEDDWILNPMNMDDTKVREKLFMDLWNENARREDSFPMSQGRYAEVIINGRYQGLYLLQRRIDDNYLNLSKTDVLLKGTEIFADDVAYDEYEVIYGPETAGSLMDTVISGSQPQILDQQALIRLNLFLQFAAGRDNVECKNMFYLFEDAEDSPRLSLIPWDTDMTFGLIWSGESFYYDEDSWDQEIMERPETAQLREFLPDYSEKSAAYWKELRETTLSSRSIQGALQNLTDQLEASGVLLRDRNLWSQRYKGEDNISSLENWISRRLIFLDQHYGYTVP